MSIHPVMRSVRRIVQCEGIVSLAMPCLVTVRYPLYAGGLFQCYILEESVCHFRGVGSIFFYFFMENPVSKQR